MSDRPDSVIKKDDLYADCANGDGTYDGFTLAQWLIEATTGKPMPRAEAVELVRQAQQRARAKLK